MSLQDNRPPKVTAPSGLPRQHPGHEHPTDSGDTDRPHRSHRWAMVACCVPMLVIVAVLLATGTAGLGAIVFAVVCVGIMTAMMLAMPRDH